MQNLIKKNPLLMLPSVLKKHVQRAILQYTSYIEIPNRN